MKRRSLPLLVVVIALALVACEPPQNYGPGATDVDLWKPHQIRVDTEVPNQYPNGRSGLTGAGAGVTDAEEEPADAH